MKKLIKRLSLSLVPLLGLSLGGLQQHALAHGTLKYVKDMTYVICQVNIPDLRNPSYNVDEESHKCVTQLQPEVEDYIFQSGICRQIGEGSYTCDLAYKSQILNQFSNHPVVKNMVKKLLCGNGHKEMAEDCDSSDPSNHANCTDTCTVSYITLPPAGGWTSCGNGTLDAGEECDDGNSKDGDGCDKNCKNGDRIFPPLAPLNGEADPIPTELAKDTGNNNPTNQNGSDPTPSTDSSAGGGCSMQGFDGGMNAGSWLVFGFGFYPSRCGFCGESHPTSIYKKERERPMIDQPFIRDGGYNPRTTLEGVDASPPSPSGSDPVNTSATESIDLFKSSQKSLKDLEKNHSSQNRRGSSPLDNLKPEPKPQDPFIIEVPRHGIIVT